MLKAQTISISALNETDINDLFRLFSQYYEQINRKKFEKDLKNKDDIILLRCIKDKKIRGFSTLKRLKFNIQNKTVVGVFSGDTIIDENFWGATALTFEFFKYVLKTKAQNPFKDVFWLLISKGFKTYLLLANNFQTYYPRYDKEIPKHYKTFLDSAYSDLFPGEYEAQSGLLKTANKYDRLKSHIAQIGDRELANPKIAFFEKENPHWYKGDELCCLGRIDMGLALRYSIRTSLKLLKRRLGISSSRTQVDIK